MSFWEQLLGSLIGTGLGYIVLWYFIRRDVYKHVKRMQECPDILRIMEPMTKEEIAEFGEDNPYRIEYAFGAVNPECDEPIMLRTADFWMPVERAEEIRDWLNHAIIYMRGRRK